MQNEKFGEVIKGKTTGTIYVLIEGGYRVINTASVKSCGAIPEYSKKRTIKIYALIDGRLVKYRPDGKRRYALKNYKNARTTINSLEGNFDGWSPQKKIDNCFKAEIN